jgi:hypothetical protein
MPAFTEQTGAENPFSGLTITHDSALIGNLVWALANFGIKMENGPYASPAGLTPTSTQTPNPDPSPNPRGRY